MEKCRTDILIIGGGGAGLRAAIEAAAQKEKVLVVSKYPLGKSGATEVAEKYFAAPFGTSLGNGPEAYYRDTLAGGYGLGEPDLIRALTQEACSRVMDLESYGLKLEKNANGSLLQLGGPGHSYPRAVAPKGGGAALMRALQKEISRLPEIQVLEDFFVTRLFKNGIRITGAVGLDLKQGKFLAIEAKAVVIASGGYSQLWSMNDVPPDCTGDGIIMAYELGAELVDLEFALFYPTAMVYPETLYGIEIPHGLLLEQIHGKLLNAKGEEFLPSKLPVRNVAVAFIYQQILLGNGSKHGGVMLDLTKSPHSPEEVRKRLLFYIPEKYRYLLDHGVDLSVQPIEVAPMAHYTLGGIRIDQEGKTNIEGLFAAGEVVGNVHGANRLAGSALTETQVFGARAGMAAAVYSRKSRYRSLTELEINAEERRSSRWLKSGMPTRRPSQIKRRLQELMWQHVGLRRDATNMVKALETIGAFKRDLEESCVPTILVYNLEWIEALEAEKMILLAELVTYSALQRKESRGHHFRVDYPKQGDQIWNKHTLIRQGKTEIILSDS